FASYCELHLQPHYESPVFMKHKLVSASSQLQKNICLHHGKLWMFTVVMTNSVSVTCAWLSVIKATNCHLWNLRVSKVRKGFTSLSLSSQSFVQAAQEDNERIFTELMNSMKRRCSEVNAPIRAQEKAELRRTEKLRQQLDRELKELRARIPEIQQVLSTNDHVNFIRVTHNTKYPSFCAMPMYKDLPTITCVTCDTSGILSISGVKKHLEDICAQEVARISKQGLNTVFQELNTGFLTAFTLKVERIL
ncbi:hypothetical protein QTP86_016557, partial [Hemibagrus guttatus]